MRQMPPEPFYGTARYSRLRYPFVDGDNAGVPAVIVRGNWIDVSRGRVDEAEKVRNTRTAMSQKTKKVMTRVAVKGFVIPGER